MSRSIVSYLCKISQGCGRKKGVLVTMMKLLLERAQRMKDAIPCKYEIGAIVPAKRSAWDGSPWRAFRLLNRRR